MVSLESDPARLHGQDDLTCGASLFLAAYVMPTMIVVRGKSGRGQSHETRLHTDRDCDPGVHAHD